MKEVISITVKEAKTKLDELNYLQDNLNILFEHLFGVLFKEKYSDKIDELEESAGLSMPIETMLCLTMQQISKSCARLENLIDNAVIEHE